MMGTMAQSRSRMLLDSESQAWLDDLRADGPRHDAAVAHLRELLVRAARFEIARRRPALPHLRGGELGDIAEEAADDAAVSVLARLDDFRGASRFTTWAYKFALLEAAVKLRRRAWQGRELPLEPESWTLVPGREPGPVETAEQSALLAAIQEGIETVLTPRQRTVLRRSRAQRHSHRRPGRAPRHHPRRALQNRARRTAQASNASDEGGFRPRRLRGGNRMTPELSSELVRLLGGGEAELGCDACFAELDRYVELGLAGEDADRTVPGMRAHLRGCPACREEHDSLRALLASEPANREERNA